MAIVEARLVRSSAFTEPPNLAYAYECIFMKMASKCKVKKTWAVQLQSRMNGYLLDVSKPQR